MADDLEDLDDWNPFEVIEEDREKLEALGVQRRDVKEFPRHLLITDPLWAREIVRKAKAEKQAEKDEKVVVVPPPEVPARPAEPGEWPRAAKTLAKKLPAPEWVHAGWFMRGPVISSANRAVPIRNAFVLEADHADGLRKIRVIWHEKDEGGKHDRKADWVYFPGHTVPWLQAVSVKALEAYVAGEYL